MKKLKLLFKRIIFFSFFISSSLWAETSFKNNKKPSDTISEIAINKNRFFKFDNAFTLSFDLSLEKGFEKYLEYLVHVVDINKQSIDIIFSSQNETESEFLIMSEGSLSKRIVKLGRSNFTRKPIPISINFDLQKDKLILKVSDTIFVENDLGLKPRTDYKVIIGKKTEFSKIYPLKIRNATMTPDLLEKPKSEIKGNNTLYWVLFIIVIDLIVFGFFIWLKRNRKKKKLISLNEKKEVDASLVYQIEKNIHQNKIEKNKSAIYLFKEFQVFDTDGNDISKKFTPLIKEFFLLLLLYTQKESKGISTLVLKDLLWFDKGIQSANNNRAVNLGKLKNILDTVGGYEIITTPLNIQIQLSDAIYCDYIEIFQLLREKTLNKEQIITIISHAKRGALLPECSYEWLDNFKAEIAEAIIDNLLGFTQLIEIKKETQLIIQISDTIFNFDNLNEKALKLKCQALIYEGRHSLANATYIRFVKDYKILYLTPYKFTFSELLKLEKND